MQLLRCLISAYDWILGRFYVLSMEFLLLSHRCFFLQNIPSGEEQEKQLFSQAIE